METQQASLYTRERVKLLAYDDEKLGAPVFVDLVFHEDAPDLEQLAGRLNMQDVVDMVRGAHAKLPRMIEVTDAVRERHTSTPEGPSMALPPQLLQKRFVFPTALERTIGEEFFIKESLSALRPILVGHGEGTPLRKLGILGRASVEEQSGTADLPFYYASLIMVLHYLARNIRRQLVTDGKIKTACDDLRGQLQVWTAKLSSQARRGSLTERILANPLSPYALGQRGKDITVEETTRTYLAFPNEYRLTPELAEAMDALFLPRLTADTQSDASHEQLRSRVLGILDMYRARVELYVKRRQLRKSGARIALAFGVALGAGMVLPWLLSPFDWITIQTKLPMRELVDRIVAGSFAGAAAAAVGYLINLASTSLWGKFQPAHEDFLRIRRWFKRDRDFRISFARALLREQLSKAIAAARREYSMSSLQALETIIPLWKKAPATIKSLLKRATRAKRPPKRAWIDEIPPLLENYLKLKSDQNDYRKLFAASLPSLDFSNLYEPQELQRKWEENACVCYDDEFSTIIIGAAKTAAVYFIDVAGSTELSTRQTLSNALEIYTRILPMVNEANGTPLWRKEVGDGRYYCYPTQEALRRAILTSMSCAHPRVSVPIGIGLSVGEIYTDVTTGDFLNEAANRAARLNGRDETVAAYIAARYTQKPFRVYVKYGRLHNSGIAIDEKAMHALGVSEWKAVELVPPLEMRFPVLTESEGTATVALYAERLLPDTVTRRLEAMGNPAQFKDLHARIDQALAFEIFCDKPAGDVQYSTPLEGRPIGEWLATNGVRNIAYAAAEVQREAVVTYRTVALPGGQKINLVVKHEKANLRGLGATAIAEVNLPNVMETDDLIRLEQFLGSRGV